MPPDRYLYVLVLKNEYTGNLFILTGSSSLKELKLVRSLWPGTCNPYRGVTHDGIG